MWVALVAGDGHCAPSEVTNTQAGGDEWLCLGEQL